MINEDEKEYVADVKKKYMVPDPTEMKMKKLRALDQSVESAGTIAALCTGIPGMLIFGLGMCFSLVWNNIAAGVIFGLIGMIIMGMAIPVMHRAKSLQKEKVQDEILELTTELM